MINFWDQLIYGTKVWNTTTAQQIFVIQNGLHFLEAQSFSIRLTFKFYLTSLIKWLDNLDSLLFCFLLNTSWLDKVFHELKIAVSFSQIQKSIDLLSHDSLAFSFLVFLQIVCFMCKMPWKSHIILIAIMQVFLLRFRHRLDRISMSHIVAVAIVLTFVPCWACQILQF